ncbi:MAG: glycoside hydrolase family 140 protein [Fibrobacteres bacterium]|nr:glycoside hydrolase family 140 protein [Fibrobacterota bacterium]
MRGLLMVCPARACALSLCLSFAVAAQLSAPLLTVGPSKHYLVDENGKPFQLRGEAAWALAVQLTREDVLAYLDDRQAKGFNALLIEAVNVDDGYAANAPKNAYGELPFVADDFTRRNEAYWAHVDFILDEAGKRGMVVLMSALYLGYNGGSEGWYAAAVSAGADAIRDYGAFLGVRYAGRKNIIWVNGGDFRPPTLAIPDALAAGILSADKNHLFTTHWARNSTGTDANPSWLTLNSSYTGIDNLASRVLADYAAAALPTLLLESYYEGSLAGQLQLTAREVRGEAWQAYLSGACGNFYGHHSVWPFPSDWRTALGSPGALSLSKQNAFFAGADWWKLVPDADNALVTTSKGSGKDMLAAARADDGSFAVVYAPGGAAFSADLSKLAGKSVKASWIDPYSGAAHGAAGSPFAKSAHAFDPAGENGKNADPAAADDWVLLLESDAATEVRDVRLTPLSRPASGFPAADACGRSLRVSHGSAAGAYFTRPEAIRFPDPD